jgi:hypothetical protein
MGERETNIHTHPQDEALNLNLWKHEELISITLLVHVRELMAKQPKLRDVALEEMY